MYNFINFKDSSLDISGESCTTALLDADSIIYIIGWQQKDSTDVEETLKKVDQFITDILITVGARQFAGFFSDKVTFRHRIYPEYKAKRPPTPDYIKFWKPIIVEHCIKEWGFELTEDSEADDAVALLQNNMENSVICSPDKDLKNVEGMNYDYKKGIFTVIDYETATRNRAEQMLKGDTSDNIEGIRGIGADKAKKLLKDIPLEELEEKVREIYCERSFLADYKLHKILIGIGEHESVDKYIWALNTFDLDNAEPSEFLKHLRGY